MRRHGCDQLVDALSLHSNGARLLIDLIREQLRQNPHDLQVALKEGQFCLNYQPFVAVESQELAGYEALLRGVERGQWFDPEFLAGLRTGTTSVSLAAGETRTLDLSIR